MATIQVRVDDKLKAQSDALFSSLGIDTSTAIRAFLQQSLLYRGLPFPLRLPNADTLAAMDDVMAGRNLRGPFTSVDSLMEDLNAGD